MRIQSVGGETSGIAQNASSEGAQIEQNTNETTDMQSDSNVGTEQVERAQPESDIAEPPVTEMSTDSLSDIEDCPNLTRENGLGTFLAFLERKN